MVGAGRESGPLARELARDGLRFVVAAAASFGLGYAIGNEVGDGIVAPLLTIAIGSILYALSATRFAWEQVRLLLGAVKPASA